MDNNARLVVVQGVCLLRDGLVELLCRDSSIEVCAVAATVKEVKDLVLEHRPNVILVNVSPQCSIGMTSLKRLSQDFAWIKFVAFSCSLEHEDVHAGIIFNSGADGYVSSIDAPDDLIAAIRAVLGGKRYMSPQIKSHHDNMAMTLPEFSTFSQREAEVFCLTGCGYPTKRIADMMGLRSKTVESYKERIRGKMGGVTGPDLLYAAVSFMRSIARRGGEYADGLELVTE